MMLKRKQALTVIGIVCVISMSMFVLYGYALSPWTTQDMVDYMYNVGKHKIWQTNWILYNEIGPTIDDIEEKLDKFDIVAEGRELFADPGDDDEADALVLVTFKGDGVTGLIVSDFEIRTRHVPPGKAIIRIADFIDWGTGAYSLRLRPKVGATWGAGDYVSELWVTDGTMKGASLLRITVT